MNTIILNLDNGVVAKQGPPNIMMACYTRIISDLLVRVRKVASKNVEECNYVVLHWAVTNPSRKLDAEGKDRIECLNIKSEKRR